MTIINSVTGMNYINIESEQASSAQAKTSDTQKKMVPASPNQPLPSINSSLSEAELWRVVSSSFKELAEGVSGTAKENSDAKKALINVVRDSQVAQLKERTEQLEKQAEAEKKKGIWGKIGMALGFIAAIIVAPFNPVMAAVMVGTMVAAIVVPKVMDKVLQAFGVDEKVRKWVSVSLEVLIGVVGAVLSFNPAKVMTSIGKVAASAAAKVANTATKAVDALKTFRAFSAISQKVQHIVNKALKMIEPLTTKIQEFAKGGQLATARVGQLTSAASDFTSVVSSGYSIKSASVVKDLEVAQATQEELETRLQQIQIMLDTAMKAMTHAFESLFDTKDAERKFAQKAISIHM
ncbi:type III secretion system translocon subunit SctE [Providencia rettgeri]|uniref:type III secretion system translocon subunit SctE n=1 Tax=Providencia rettgeri TaxID=587 RepID=UPI000D7E308C|nr:type III secretion system translocon subunit SctE [Providencia rettgeri]AWS50747.1 VspD [Providencia rettgeri]